MISITGETLLRNQLIICLVLENNPNESKAFRNTDYDRASSVTRSFDLSSHSYLVDWSARCRNGASSIVT